MKKKYFIFVLLLALCIGGLQLHTHAQEKQENLANRFIGFFKKSNYVIAPIIAYMPATSWQFGVGIKYLYRPSAYDSITTRKSFVAASAIYTLNNQLLINPYFIHFFNEEKYMLDGYYGFKKFPQNYYGVGNQTLTTTQEIVDLNEIKIEQLAFRKISDDWFAGIGYRVIGAANLKAVKNGALESQQPSGWQGFWAHGPSLNARLDDRDNILNARKGKYIDIRLERMWLKQKYRSQYTMLKIDTRKYISPFANKQRVLAGQLYSQTALSGNIPFTEMAFVGSESMLRGYNNKRYIDRHFIGGQIEYRHPLPYNFGFVLFTGLGDVSNSLDAFQFNQLKYSLGGGLRYKIIPKEDINIRLDYGIGRKSNTFYLSIAEAF